MQHSRALEELGQKDGIINCGGAELNKQKVQHSEDGKWLFVAGGNDIQVYSYASQELVCTLRHHAAKVTGIAVSPFHKMQLFTSSMDGHVAVWDYSDGRLLRYIDFGAPLHRFALSPGKIEPLVFCLVTKTDISEPKNVIVGMPSHLLTERQLGTTTLGDHLASAQQFLQLGSGKNQSDFVFTYNGKFLVSYVNKRVLMYNLEMDEAYKYEVECTVTSVTSHPSQMCIATGNRIGQIHLWYEFGKSESAVVTTVYHWHAHAVADLQFTTDGTYLLSGGEESVLVLWQLATNRKYFRPRLGSPITRVSCSPGDQYFTVCLQSNVIRVVSGLNNDVQFTLGGLRKAFLQDPKALGMKTGLVYNPRLNTIAMNSTPGFIQFYSPSSGGVLQELDVVGLNYVSRPNEAPLVQTTVEHIAFSPGDGRWMTTVEARDDGCTAPELRLKMWRFNEHHQSYILCACVDPPHDKPVTSLAFQPHPCVSEEFSHMLVSTSLDGKFKVWVLLGGEDEGEEAWACRSVGYYHSLPCRGAQFSADGSLLAVNYGRCITLWNPIASAIKTVLNGVLQKEEFKHVVFGQHSSSHCLVAATSSHLYVWDLLSCSVLWCVEASVERLVADPFGMLVAAFVSMTTDADGTKAIHVYLISPLCSAPMAIHEDVCKGGVLGAVFVPGAMKKGVSTRSTLFFMDPKQTLYCLGDKDRLTDGTMILSVESLHQIQKTEQAFVEIFGDPSQTRVPPNQLFPQTDAIIHSVNGTQHHQVYNAPPHALPPMSGLCMSFLKSLLPAAAKEPSSIDVTNGLSGDGEEKGCDIGGESEDDDDNEKRPQEINFVTEVSMDIELAYERTTQVEAYEWLFVPP